MLKMRNQLEFQEKFQEELRKSNIDALILTKQESVFYATGYASRFLSLMQKPGVAYAIVPKEGKCKLIVNDFEKQTAEFQCKDIEIIKYDSWIFIDDGEKPAKEKTTQMNLNQSYDIGIEIIKGITPYAKVGIELDFLTWEYVEQLKHTFGKDNLVNCSPLFNKVRSIKTKWEIDMLRGAAKIAEQAMYFTAKELQPGMNEFDIHSIYRRNVNSINKNIVDTLMISSIGPHYSAPYIPRDYVLQQRDIVRLDGGVNYYGYRSDIARTFVIGGQASLKQEEKYQAILAGYRKGLAMIKPGIKFSTVFAEVQKAVRSSGIPQYTRGHVGHSISVDAFIEEPPFIAPTNDAVFESGMVFCIECPYYSTIGGFNVEDTFLVNENGIELFTTANETLNWPDK